MTKGEWDVLWKEALGHRGTHSSRDEAYLDGFYHSCFHTHSFDKSVDEIYRDHKYYPENLRVDFEEGWLDGKSERESKPS